MPNLRYDFYESDGDVTISIYDRGAKEDVATVTIGPNKVSYENGDKTLVLEPLNGPIDPARSATTVRAYKVEILLIKTDFGKWGDLLGSVDSSAPAEKAASSPTSTKAHKDWNKIADDLLEVDDGSANASKAKPADDVDTPKSDTDSLEGYKIGPPEHLPLHCGSTRYICRFWPRKPGGALLFDKAIRGKETSNGLPIWGATLLDFYRVCRNPEIPGYMTTTSGSRLAAWMKAIGELDHAVEELDWAAREEDPVQLAPCDIGELIACTETRLGWRLWGKTISAGTQSEQDSAQTSDSAEAGVLPDVQPKPPATAASSDESNDGAPTSIFDFASHGEPWPLYPFSYTPPTLANRLSLHLLPEKLVVHDPWNVLHVKPSRPADDESRDDEDKDEGSPDDLWDWANVKDNVRMFKLSLSPAAQKAVDETRSKLAAENSASKDPSLQLITRVKENVKTLPALARQPIMPPEPTSTPEAHLYLSPARQAGEGHHSVVYRAEWELPRSLLVGKKLCQTCFRESIEKEAKRPEQDLELVNATLRRVIHKLEIKEPAVATLSYEMLGPATLETPVGMWSVKGDYRPSLAFSFGSEGSETAGKDAKGKGQATDSEDVDANTRYLVQPAQSVLEYTYEGPVRIITPKARWQDPPHEPYCEHANRLITGGTVPPTTRVQVIAKLSKQGDDHLAREAKNFQAFPAHMFEHWSGYNICPPLHDPVPVGAVVPQFYGYYVPEEEDAEGQYISPIMLLEDCGTPVNPAELNLDDRRECASLLYRLHHAGWLHNSVFERNIMMQAGPIHTFPLDRMVEPVPSFRLIDFGRSVSVDGMKAESERDGRVETEKELLHRFGMCRASEEALVDDCLHVVNLVPDHLG